jgi:hypothetical protein
MIRNFMVNKHLHLASKIKLFQIVFLFPYNRVCNFLWKWCYLQQCLLPLSLDCRVKQKTCKSTVHHNDVHCIQDPEIVEKRSLPTDDKVLAIEYRIDSSKHQEEEVHCDHQPEENPKSNHNLENGRTSLKRKWRDGDARIPGSSKYPPLFVVVFSLHFLPMKYAIHTCSSSIPIRSKAGVLTN